MLICIYFWNIYSSCCRVAVKHYSENIKKQKFLKDLEWHWHGQKTEILPYLKYDEHLWDIIWDYSFGMEKYFL